MILTGPISGIPTIAGRVYRTSSAIAAQVGDLVLVDAAAAAITITLPAPAQGLAVTVKKIDGTANAVTVNPGSSTIDGSASASLSTANEAITFVGDGANWWRA